MTEKQRMTAVQRLGESERLLRRCESALQRAKGYLETKAAEHAAAVEDERQAQAAHDKARLEYIVAKRAYESDVTEGPAALKDPSREVKHNGHERP